MPSRDKHAILLNLEPELHAQITAAAKASSVSNSEYIRKAVKMRLDKKEQPPADLFTVVPEAGYRIQTTIMPPIQTPDKPGAEYWLGRIKTWARMDGHRATAELLQSTGGVMPPGTLFGSAPELAKWLVENAKC